MKRITTIMLIVVTTSIYAQTPADSIPEWYTNPPKSSKVFYGIGLGVSKSMDIAEQKALLDAKICIAEQVEPAKVKEIRKTTKSKSGKLTRNSFNRRL